MHRLSTARPVPDFEVADPAVRRPGRARVRLASQEAAALTRRAAPDSSIDMVALAAMFVCGCRAGHGAPHNRGMSWQLWLAFFAAAWAISLSPGPGAVAVMSASLQHGLARGCFAIVKWLGVAYLVYLGIRQWRAPPLALASATAEPSTPATRSRIVVEAWLLNAVNPKGTAFMLAVVPQFLTPSEPLVPQYLAIG